MKLESTPTITTLTTYMKLNNIALAKISYGPTLHTSKGLYFGPQDFINEI